MLGMYLGRDGLEIWKMTMAADEQDQIRYISHFQSVHRYSSVLDISNLFENSSFGMRYIV